MASARHGAAAFAVLAIAGLAAATAEACASDAADAPSVDAAPETSIESSVVDAPEETLPPRTSCALDADCKAPNGCYTGHCDAVLGTCTYALCESKGRACTAGSCDKATFTCKDAKDYGLRTTTYAVDDTTLGCGANPSRCFAAVYPFVFVGTGADVAVLLADDLLATAPTIVTRARPAIKPAWVVASGRRLWIVGEVQGAAAPHSLQIASIDVPSDPTQTHIDEQAVTVTWPFPDAVAFPAPDGGLYLAYNDANEGLPAALLKPPLVGAPTFAVENPADAGPPSPAPSHPMFRVAAQPGSTLVASSGARLVAYRFGGPLNLVTAPATANAALQPDLALQPPLPALAVPKFAQGPDGVVLLSGPVVADNPLPDCNCTTHERITWFLPNAVATSSDVNQATDLEGFTNNQVGGGMCRQCVGGYSLLPSETAWVDAKTALFASPASTNRALLAVRVVGRDPVASPPARRFMTAATEVPPGNFAVDHIAIASSNGFGYLLEADAQGMNVNLSLIDPRCDAK